MIPPVKPFPDYKWRWAVLTPTESLNEPTLFLGVLRVLREHEGQRPRDLTDNLAIVSRTARIGANLSRSKERNLLRNSGQYWKALGLLADTRGGIRLTDIGRRVADGGITRDEFAATTVKTLELPNQNIEQDLGEWTRANLRIRPLQLILEVLLALGRTLGSDNAFLTPEELVKVVIPLAGTMAPIPEYEDSIGRFRNLQLDLTRWPDCAPGANDKRMAREFLLFLDHYDFCQRVVGLNNSQDRFYISDDMVSDVEGVVTLPAAEDVEEVLAGVRASHPTPRVKRKRVMGTRLSRPQQPRFRRDVLEAYRNRCFFTGEIILETLEAGHIIPAEFDGPDDVGNGICLRSDIHDLFDAHHLRVSPEGAVCYSDVVRQSENYRNLPNRVELPTFLTMESIEWRWKHY